MNTDIFPKNSIIIDSTLYSFEYDPCGTCESCDLARICYTEWQPEGIQPCTIFGNPNAVFKEHTIPTRKYDRFTFGKFKGKSISEVIDTDPHYVEWAVNNVDWFDIDDEQREELEKSLKNARRSNKYPNSTYSEDGEIACRDAFGTIY